VANAKIFLGFRDLQKIIDLKNMAAGEARRHVFGFYMDRFFFGVPLSQRKALDQHNYS
jgi:hypothetical protein